MLTPKNAMIASATVFTVAIVASWLSLLGPPDSGGMGQDSYGTRSKGHRALLDVLAELGIDVERSLSPPNAGRSPHQTVALVRPHAGLVGIEPEYIEALSEWVQDGGRLVVTPPDTRDRPSAAVLASAESDAAGLLTILGLGDVVVNSIAVGEEFDGDLDDDLDGTSRHLRGRQRSMYEDSPLSVILEDIGTTTVPPRTIDVASTAALADVFVEVRRLSVPGYNLQVLECGEQTPRGTLTYTRDASDVGEEHERILAASFRHGDGEVVLLADARLLTNRYIGLDDNSLFAVNLVSPSGGGVVFDEFYHGLAVRGNPLYVMTHVGTAVVTLLVIALAALWVWRAAVFLGPPLADRPSPRRDIGEYVDAMGRFLGGGRESGAFFLREIRDGVLRTVSRECGLAPGRQDVGSITAVLARRDEARANQLSQSIRATDASLSQPRAPSEKESIHLMQELLTCLSNRPTP